MDGRSFSEAISQGIGCLIALVFLSGIALGAAVVTLCWLFR